ncbi:MAG: hypothetical protein A2648_01980 [Candidatus Lloydbacteria bacterium RIFCSPHIGHO2_01_FULL_41_20]|uniref:Uncharacterized protein n=1 Tax=Candidatus Lloydbacteria bacterium RIFCSPHIGHO2_01_FULL_41_20 TaxID=1798657 RepID=A0A1G2CR67_9BACT|nr:MAG: hypothetical protein A2648_01980 [Candidatus Lloydbacteria bacterium RIFCSPHIGHO2_01_FULL_41_20]
MEKNGRKRLFFLILSLLGIAFIFYYAYKWQNESIVLGWQVNFYSAGRYIDGESLAWKPDVKKNKKGCYIIAENEYCGKDLSYTIKRHLTCIKCNF